MTNKELIKKLKQFPENMDVFIENQSKIDFDYLLLASAKKKKIVFSEENGKQGDAFCKETVIVLKAID